MTDIKPIGYTLGPKYPSGSDATPKPQPVFELTPEQERLKERVEAAQAALKQVEQERTNLNADIEKAKAECSHPVFFDTDNYPWYDRSCLICGRHIDRL